MPDAKVAGTTPADSKSDRPEPTPLRDARAHQQARRHSERLVAEWLRRLSTRRSG